MPAVKFSGRHRRGRHGDLMWCNSGPSPWSDWWWLGLFVVQGCSSRPPPGQSDIIVRPSSPDRNCWSVVFYWHLHRLAQRDREGCWSSRWSWGRSESSYSTWTCSCDVKDASRVVQEASWELKTLSVLKKLLELWDERVKRGQHHRITSQSLQLHSLHCLVQPSKVALETDSRQAHEKKKPSGQKTN